VSLNSLAQDYVDILNISYSEGFDADFEDNSGQTRVTSFDVGFTYPIVLNENNALITGVDYSRTTLPLSFTASDSHLNSTTLKLGWAKTFNERWSATLVFLPKIASDYKDIDGDDFYFGGFGVVKYQQKENLLYRFGLYASSEAFGIIATPIFGLYYTSTDDLWEVDLSLPIAANINYIVANNLKLGADYVGLGRSYSLTTNNVKSTYVLQNSLDFSLYLEKAFVDQSILIRLKAGVSTNDYELYNIDETIDLGLSAFRFGDDRTQLNQNISTAPFLKIEAIYRFYIEKD
jgi:hypothetical protein